MSRMASTGADAGGRHGIPQLETAGRPQSCVTRGAPLMCIVMQRLAYE